MKPPNQFIVFNLDGQRYALDLSVVGRVVRIVEITLLPKTPEIVLGVINVQGQIIPVLNIRKRFLLPEREVNLTDQLIIAHTSKRTIALVADEVSSVVEQPEQGVIAAEQIFSGTEYIDRVVKVEDDIVPVLDLDSFLSIEEKKILDEAMVNS